MLKNKQLDKPSPFTVYIRIISFILLITFLAQDIAWASSDAFAIRNSQHDKLAASSFFDKDLARERAYTRYIESLIERTGIPRDKLTLDALKTVVKKHKEENWSKNNLVFAESESDFRITFPSGRALRYYVKDDGMLHAQLLQPLHRASASGAIQRKTVRDLILRSEESSENWLEAHSVAFGNVIVDNIPQPVPLSRVFVTPGTIEDIDKALGMTDWISVVGEAGFGKTNIIWYLYREKKNSKDVFPIIIDATSEDFIRGRITADKIRQIAEYEKKESNRQTLVFMDTLDYAISSRDNIESLANFIASLNRKGIKVITFSRPQEWKAMAEHYEHRVPGIEIELNGFSENEIEEALKGYVSIYHSLDKSKDKDKIANEVERLKQNKMFIDLCRNPLYMAMVFAVYSPRSIPQDISTKKLYERFWEIKVKGSRLLKRQRDPEKEKKRQGLFICKEKLVMLLAWLMLKNGSLSLNYTELTSEYRDVLDYMAGDYINWQTAYENLESEGIINESKEGGIRFFHQTFFEYAAARALLGYKESAEIKEAIDRLLASKNVHFYLPIIEQIAVSKIEKDLRCRILKKLASYENDVIAQSLAIKIYTELEPDPKDKKETFKEEREIITSLADNNETLAEYFISSVASTTFFIRRREEEALNILDSYAKSYPVKDAYLTIVNKGYNLNKIVIHALEMLKDDHEDAQSFALDIIAAAIEGGYRKDLNALVSVALEKTNRTNSVSLENKAVKVVEAAVKNGFNADTLIAHALKMLEGDDEHDKSLALDIITAVIKGGYRENIGTIVTHSLGILEEVYAGAWYGFVYARALNVISAAINGGYHENLETIVTRLLEMLDGLLILYDRNIELSSILNVISAAINGGYHENLETIVTRIVADSHWEKYRQDCHLYFSRLLVLHAIAKVESKERFEVARYISTRLFERWFPNPFYFVLFEIIIAANTHDILTDKISKLINNKEEFTKPSSLTFIAMAIDKGYIKEKDLDRVADYAIEILSQAIESKVIQESATEASILELVVAAVAKGYNKNLDILIACALNKLLSNYALSRCWALRIIGEVIKRGYKKALDELIARVLEISEKGYVESESIKVVMAAIKEGYGVNKLVAHAWEMLKNENKNVKSTALKMIEIAMDEGYTPHQIQSYILENHDRYSLEVKNAVSRLIIEKTRVMALEFKPAQPLDLIPPPFMMNTHQRITAADKLAEKGIDISDGYEDLINASEEEFVQAVRPFEEALLVKIDYLGIYYNLWSMLNFYILRTAIKIAKLKADQRDKTLQELLTSDTLLKLLSDTNGIGSVALKTTILELADSKYIQEIISGYEKEIAIFNIERELFYKIQELLSTYIMAFWKRHGMENKIAEDFIDSYLTKETLLYDLWHIFFEDKKASYVIHFSPSLEQKLIFERYREKGKPRDEKPPEKPSILHLRLLGAINKPVMLMQDHEDTDYMSSKKANLYLAHQKAKMPGSERMVSHRGTFATTNKRGGVSGASIDTVFMDSFLHRLIYHDEEMQKRIRRVAELGVGTAYLLTSLVSNLNHLDYIVGDDLDEESVEIAGNNVSRVIENRSKNETEYKRPAFGDILKGGYTLPQLIPEPKEGNGFDLVVLNPPYLPAEKLDTDSKDSYWGGHTLDFMCEVVGTAHQLLNRDGMLFMLHSSTSQALLNSFVERNPNICWENLTPEGGRRVPLDLTEVYGWKRRADYLKHFGLEERITEKAYPYWHNIRVIVMYREDNSLRGEDGTIFGMPTALTEGRGMSERETSQAGQGSTEMTEGTESSFRDVTSKDHPRRSASGTETPAKIEAPLTTSTAVTPYAAMDEYFYNINRLNERGEKAEETAQNRQILLSDSLFDAADAVYLNRCLIGAYGENPPIQILPADKINITARNQRKTRQSLVCVIAASDYDDPNTWNQDNGHQINAALIVLKEDFRGMRYAYLKGMVGLAQAMMSGDNELINDYLETMFDKTEAIDSTELLQLLLNDPREFANRIKFKPLTPHDTEELPKEHQIELENFLIAA